MRKWWESASRRQKILVIILTFMGATVVGGLSGVIPSCASYRGVAAERLPAVCIYWPEHHVRHLGPMLVYPRWQGLPRALQSPPPE